MSDVKNIIRDWQFLLLSANVYMLPWVQSNLPLVVAVFDFITK
ncbi:hypothetical protein AGMMS49975_14690 [Clostridia bacterium]|nr:hypothetical protein AGMMS49975_14690 [Clostridia bacterium]GHU74687.1 hypothetical protein FACS1894188_03700 [Clostridia bacterium]